MGRQISAAVHSSAGVQSVANGAFGLEIFCSRAPDSGVPGRWNSNPSPTLVSEPQRQRHMTSQGPTDPPTSTPRRGLWGIGFLVVVLLFMAAFAYVNRSPTSSTATGPSTTQSAP